MTDARGAGLLAGPDGVFETFCVLDLVIGCEEIDKLVDRGLFIRGAEGSQDAFDGEDFGEIHSFLPWITCDRH